MRVSSSTSRLGRKEVLFVIYWVDWIGATTKEKEDEDACEGRKNDSAFLVQPPSYSVMGQGKTAQVESNEPEQAVHYYAISGCIFKTAASIAKIQLTLNN